MKKNITLHREDKLNELEEQKGRKHARTLTLHAPYKKFSPTSFKSPKDIKNQQQKNKYFSLQKVRNLHIQHLMKDLLLKSKLISPEKEAPKFQVKRQLSMKKKNLLIKEMTTMKGIDGSLSFKNKMEEGGDSGLKRSKKLGDQLKTGEKCIEENGKKAEIVINMVLQISLQLKKEITLLQSKISDFIGSFIMKGFQEIEGELMDVIEVLDTFSLKAQNIEGKVMALIQQNDYLKGAKMDKVEKIDKAENNVEQIKTIEGISLRIKTERSLIKGTEQNKQLSFGEREEQQQQSTRTFKNQESGQYFLPIFRNLFNKSYTNSSQTNRQNLPEEKTISSQNPKSSSISNTERSYSLNMDSSLDIKIKGLDDVMSKIKNIILLTQANKEIPYHQNT